MANALPPLPPPAQDGRILSWLNAVKGLTISNVLVIAMLIVVAVPTYLIYRVVNDHELLDRFLSHYREISSQNVGCTLREARDRGSAEFFGISTGFAYQGRDKYIISVVLDHHPSDEELNSYCATVKAIADSLQAPP
jgi:hypothetical protein